MMIAARDVHDVLPVQVYVHQNGCEALVGRAISQFTVAIVTPGIYLMMENDDIIDAVISRTSLKC